MNVGILNVRFKQLAGLRQGLVVKTVGMHRIADFVSVCYAPFCEGLQIESAFLGNDAGMIGAVKFFMEKSYELI